MKVFKYPFTVADRVVFMLPYDAQILHIDKQPGLTEIDGWSLWALVTPEAVPVTTRVIVFAGTGHTINEDVDNLRYINSTLIRNGELVFHFFEVLNAHNG